MDWPGPNDPFYLFNPSENGNRRGFYGINSIPQTQVDGILDGGSSSQHWSIISNRLRDSSPIEITMDGTFNESSRTGSLHVTATATDDISVDGLYLRVALTESEIYYPAPNGVNVHNQTMRYMFPYSLGTRIYLTDEGDVADVDLDIFCPEPIVIENSELVIFVQAQGTREVFQTTKIPLTELTQVGIEDDIASLPKQLQLAQNYPNPFNANTVINYQLDKESHVTLDVYDILGRKITTLVDSRQAAGNYNVTWKSLDKNGKSVASGVYFYKLTTETNSEIKRMMLVK
jgi:hypothetical protein